MIYLLHFERKLSHAGHYMGFTDDLDSRLERHRAGNGARLMEVVTQAGIEWKLVRTWPGDRNFERRLKNRKDATKLCPICNEKAMSRGNYSEDKKAVTKAATASKRTK
jgi:predicted GIY-YIG superfamily endonuclease